MSRFDPEIARYQTVAMQRLLDGVVHGYRHHAGGVVVAAKAPALAEKFDRLYGAGASRNQRAYRKTKGLANSLFILHPERDAPRFRWWLLVTEGAGLVHERERLADAHAPGQRLTWGDRFELIHLPRQGRGVRWTWRMTDAEYLGWRDRIDVAVRHRDGADLTRQLVWSLSRVPGFGGLRDQVSPAHARPTHRRG